MVNVLFVHLYISSINHNVDNGLFKFQIPIFVNCSYDIDTAFPLSHTFFSFISRTGKVNTYSLKK